MKYTKRSIFRLYWTTNPADMGYGGNKTPWNQGKPDFRGTSKTLREQWTEEKRNCGLDGGAHYATCIRDTNGDELSWQDLRDIEAGFY